jgi:hypothetical protein
MTFPEKPTTKDLSDLPANKAFPAYHSSMAAGNTVTTKDPNFGGQGTPSEATQDVVAKEFSYVGFSHDTPELPGPDADEAKPDNVKASGYNPPAPAWKGLH